MISSSDVATILYRDLQKFNIPIYKKGAIPNGRIETDRICIHAKSLKKSIAWEKGFVEVNFCVPNRDNKANLKRLSEWERIGKSLKGCNVFDNTRYRYSMESTSIEEDAPIDCYFVNVRILFECKNY